MLAREQPNEPLLELVEFLRERHEALAKRDVKMEGTGRNGVTGV